MIKSIRLLGSGRKPRSAAWWRALAPRFALGRLQNRCFIYAFVRKEAVISSQSEGTQATLVDLTSTGTDGWAVSSSRCASKSGSCSRSRSST